MVSQLIAQLTNEFESARNPEKAAGMKRYMKDRFEFLGLQKPERGRLQKPFIEEAKKYSWKEIESLVNALWQLQYREYRYVAMDLLLATRRKWGTDAFDFFVSLITKDSWWDTVDLLAARMVGGVVSKDPERYRGTLLEMAGSEDLWLRRTALIHQLFYKEKTDTTLFEAIYMKCRHDTDFFIRKAVGWALRQYSATDPVFVRKFVEKHSIVGLAGKEALRKIGG
jgi:3-methyladenine DNA glycosylase AlkD